MASIADDLLEIPFQEYDDDFNATFVMSCMQMCRRRYYSVVRTTAYLHHTPYKMHAVECAVAQCQVCPFHSFFGMFMIPCLNKTSAVLEFS